MTHGVFVTGTDTGVGKTLVAAGMVLALRRLGLRAAGMKPVAAGCRRTPEGLRNDDAETLRRVAAIDSGYDEVNPVALEPAIAPHIAAAEAGRTLELAPLEDAYRAIAARADVCVVEGAGGWLVPLDAHSTLADLAVALRLPVILVVAVRLGCINHALLTADGVAARGLPLLGWIANFPGERAARASENVAALEERLPAPRLATLAPLSRPLPEHVVDDLLPAARALRAAGERWS